MQEPWVKLEFLLPLICPLSVRNYGGLCFWFSFETSLVAQTASMSEKLKTSYSLKGKLFRNFQSNKIVLKKHRSSLMAQSAYECTFC